MPETSFNIPANPCASVAECVSASADKRQAIDIEMRAHPAFHHALQKSRRVKAGCRSGGYQIREWSNGRDPRVVSCAGVHGLLKQRPCENSQGGVPVDRAANRGLAADGYCRGVQKCENAWRHAVAAA